MSEQQLERSVLEGKERDELLAIAGALGLNPGTRTKKADLVDGILRATGVDVGEAPAKPKRARKPKADDGADGDGGASVEPAAAELPLDGAAAAGEGSSAAAGDDGPATAAEELEEGDDGGADDGSGDDDRHENRHEDRHEDRHDDRQDERVQAGRPGDGDRTGPAPGGPQGQGPAYAQAGTATYEEGGSRRSRRRRNRDRGPGDGTEPQFAGEPQPVAGILDLRPEGFGFLRTRGYLGSTEDVYVSTSQVRRFALRPGDHVVGASRSATTQEKFPALLQIDEISGLTPEEARQRPRFEELTPAFADVPLSLEVPAGQPAHVTGRVIDLVCPIGRGSRVLVAGPYKSGKSTVLVHAAAAIASNAPDVQLVVVLVDERPEEVAEVRRLLGEGAEVVGSTFDRPAEEHVAVVELVLERARRAVEQGRDVVVVLDGVTRLGRAHNLVAAAGGRTLPGGLEASAVNPLKRAMGAARNTEEAGSLTIVAAALTGTGSGLDDAILDELRGTATTEIRLDRALVERGVRPAIDLAASSTLREERLLDQADLEVVWRLRRSLIDQAGDRSPLEVLLERIAATEDDAALLSQG